MRHPQTNGFVVRFNRTVLDGFFRKAFREKYYESVEALQVDLDVWLAHYNTERPHRGYRDMGKRPIDTINLYLEELEAQKLCSSIDSLQSDDPLCALARDAYFVICLNDP